MTNTDKLKKTVEDFELQAKAEKLKKTIEELDLPAKAEKLASVTSQTAREGLSKAGALTHKNRDKVDSAIDKLGDSINQLTKGKSAETVAKAKVQMAKGVDKLSEQRPSEAAPADDERPDDERPGDERPGDNA